MITKKQLQQAIRQNPGNVPAYIALGDLCLGSSEVENALMNYRTAVDIDPSCGKAWVRLGHVYKVIGNYKESEACCRKGVLLLPHSIDARAQLATTLCAQGALGEALLEYKAALEIDSGSTAIWSQLCWLYIQTGDYQNTERCCREIIARVPDSPDSYINLGSALQQQDKLDEAESAYKIALKINPSLEKAKLNLIVVQYRLGKLDEAMECAQQTLDVGVNPAAALCQASLNLESRGKLTEALYCGFGALTCYPDNMEYRRHFANLLNAARPQRVSKIMLEEIGRCFITDGLSTSYLIPPCLTLLLEDPEIIHIMRCASRGATELIKEGVITGKYDVLFKHPILLKLLTLTIIPHWGFEVLLSTIRNIFLDLATHQQQLEVDECLSRNSKFICALSHYHFNTEYVSSITERERIRVQDLATNLVDAMKDNISADPVTIARLVICSMYMPLSSLALSESIVKQLLDTNDDLIRSLCKSQWIDYMEEQSIRNQILQLTPIQDTVSSSVRDQYEVSPYPRWQNTNVYRPLSIDDFMRFIFSSYEPPCLSAVEPEVLIAGCGTGRQAIMTASILARSNVLAIDLSLSSLAYAIRKAKELGVSNITFAQADIMEFRLDRKFHIIESVGVLHHLAEPESGLKILINCLEANGLLRIGLYSDIARQSITSAKEFISAKGYSSSSDDIRLARKEIQELDEEHPARGVVRAADFFSLSECRDLLFHTQERNYRLHEISQTLDNCGLECVGFESPGNEVTRRYNELFPDDPMRASLANWEQFEVMYPDTFTGMYTFWCRKAG